MNCFFVLFSGLAQVMDKIHVSASSRLYESHDTPLLLVQLLAMEPWRRLDKDGNTLLYIRNKHSIYFMLLYFLHLRNKNKLPICLWRFCENSPQGRCTVMTY